MLLKIKRHDVGCVSSSTTDLNEDFAIIRNVWLIQYATEFTFSNWLTSMHIQHKTSEDGGTYVSEILLDEKDLLVFKLKHCS
jgi:hypothetical protein